MTIYHNKGLWSDQLNQSPKTLAATLAKFAAWNSRDDPTAAYAANGWQLVTESAPAYENSPLTGQKVRKLDSGGTTWSWHVGDVRWDQAIDTVAQARQQAEAAVAAVRAASIAVGIPIVLPADSTLDGVDASGQTVRLHLSDAEPHETYWQDIQGRHSLGVASPKFESLDGRCEVPIEYFGTIIAIVFAAKGKADTAQQDADRGIELGKYSDVIAMAQGFASRGTPTAVDVAAVHDAAF